MFQICGDQNWPKLNTLDNADTETISSLIVSPSQHAGGYAISRQNNVELHLPYLLVELYYIGMPVVWVDGERAYGHVIIKIPRMGRLPNFLTHGAPLRVLRAPKPPL